MVGHVLTVNQAQPDLLLSATGSPAIEHIRRAAALRLGLGEKTSAALQSPDGAKVLVYSLLLSPEEATRSGQLELLAQKLDSGACQQVRVLLSEVRNLDRRVKLPLIDLTLPALRHLKPHDYRQFVQLVQELIEYDRAIDLFEYTLQKILFRHLQPYYELMPRRSRRHSSLQSLLPECTVVLSALAHVGSQEEEAITAAFQRGTNYLDLVEGAVQLLTGDDRSLTRVDSALDRLAETSPSVRRNILLACAHTVASDGQVLYREAELLRAIADTLDCPMPPFVKALEGQQSV